MAARAKAAIGSADVPASVVEQCTSLHELATAAGLSDPAWDALEAGLGVPDAFEDVALLEPADIATIMTPGPLSSGFQPSPVDKARAMRFYRACKIRCGLLQQAQAAPGPAPDAPSESALS